MIKIKVKNFGPIKEGFGEKWLVIEKVTLFIGNQGSGKSTVAKLISTLSWIEKTMVRGILRHDELNTHNRFLKQLAYQRLTNYIQDNTEIEYQGEAFTFKFQRGNFSTSKIPSNSYVLPKIMYVPAERNFLSVVDRPDKLKNLPSPLYTFNDEYDVAKNIFASGIKLPINESKFEYDKLNKLAHIVSSNFKKIRLSEASSGFQSTIPLFLVTKFLTENLHAENDAALNEYSLEEQKRLDKEIKIIFEDSSISSDIRQAFLRQLSAKRKPSCFINIVEEPEQNLFPTSQEKILYELLKFNNRNLNNKLILTTHSPYIINYLSIAIQAGFLKEKINTISLKERLKEIIPLESTVLSTSVVVYQLNEIEGTITKLLNNEGIPSDKNYLNQSLQDGNSKFDSLLEIEQEL